MSHVEVLLGLHQAFPNHPTFKAVLSLFQQHVAGLQAIQDAADGRWHQVLDDSSTFLETSCTSMFLWSIITGVQKGWLDPSTYAPTIELAWRGLQAVFQDNGVVSGICEGTGIGPNVMFYEERSTNYTISSPGLGSVLRAIAAYQRYKGQT